MRYTYSIMEKKHFTLSLRRGTKRSVHVRSLIAPAERTYIDSFWGVEVQDKPLDLDGHLALGRRIKNLLLRSANAQ
jgi:hypothetical protein